MTTGREDTAIGDAPLRVLMAVPRYPFPVVGGLERQAHQLALALRRQGVQVSAVSGAVERGRVGAENVEGVRVMRLPLTGGPRDALTLWRHLWSTRGDYDLVHLHNLSRFGATVMAAVKVAGRPLLAKLPNFGPFGIPGMRAGPAGQLGVDLLRRSDVIVAMTPESLEELDAIGFPRSRTLVMTNGIEAARFQTPKTWDGDFVEFGFVGRLDEMKGLPDLLQAWAKMSLAMPAPARLHIFGAGPYEGELQARIAQLGLGETVLMRGYVSDVAAALAELDVFVLPSYAEGNSNAVLEAMAAGLPVVSTKVGGTGLLVGPIGAPWLVAPGDIAGLARVMADLLAADEKRRRLGDAMRERVTRQFDMDVVAATYACAYRLLVARRRDDVGALSLCEF